MSVSIVSCPTCKTLLLSDTIRCPLCMHVFDPERAAAFSDDPLPSQLTSSTVEDPCGNCGEMVRRGLVRCWNCGAFMRRDIAASFRQMRDNPAPVTYSRLEDKARSDQKRKKPPATTRHVESSSKQEVQRQAVPAEEDDFELASGIAADDDDFELGADVASQTPATAPAPGSGVVQKPIQPPETKPAEPPETKPAEPPETKPAEPEPPSQDVEATIPLAKPEPEAKEGDEQPEPEAEQGEKKSEPEDAKSKLDAEETETQEAHSIATGGDALLQVALSEEAETHERRSHARRGRRTRGPSAPNRVMVYCPNGHRIEVHERHRGKAGRCPKCKELFSVPTQSWAEILAERTKAVAEAAGKEGKAAPEKTTVWLKDVHVHAVEPAKLKLKAGSLQSLFEPLDFGLTEEGLLAVKLLKKVGMGKSADKKKDPVRETILTHLREGKPLKELPAFEHKLFAADTVRDIRIVQPAAYEHESMFAGVPVFGVGRITVRFPKLEGQETPYFASFTLSEFREFEKSLSDRYGFDELEQESHECSVPLTDEFTALKCHYTEQELRVLENLEFYQNDPAFDVKQIGWRCQACKLAISMDGQKKEKIGGKAGKGIAKAECPKCKAKFGDVKVYTIDIESPETESTASGDETPSEKSESADSTQTESTPAEAKSTESASTDKPGTETDEKKE